jgi:hypothetical protein
VTAHVITFQKGDAGDPLRLGGEFAGRAAWYSRFRLRCAGQNRFDLDATDGSSSLEACRKQRTDRRVTNDVRTWLGASRTARD